MITQRNALLAWTGHTLSLRPTISTQMVGQRSRFSLRISLIVLQSLAHWGNTRVTGRGLICLSGKGQVYQVSLKTGEEYVVHPR